MRGFFIFLFSKRMRLALAYAFIILNIVQVFDGIVITAGSIFICMSVSRNLFSEKSEIRFVFTVLAIFGSHIIIQYLIGIKLVEKCMVKAHKRSTKRQLYFWLLACSNTLLNIVILASMAVKISKHIVRSVRHSMEKGMRHYLSDVVWKHTMDQWQFRLKCCGITSYRDWYELSWLDKSHLDVSDANLKSLLLSKDHLHLPVVPWSCCDVESPIQCFHDPIQQIRFSHVWKEQPDLPEKTLYTMGCLDVIRYPIEIALTIFILSTVLLIFNHILITIVARFLYTSCRNAVILRNTDGVAPGWLFDRDFFANTKGRSLHKILADMGGDQTVPSMANKGTITWIPRMKKLKRIAQGLGHAQEREKGHGHPGAHNRSNHPTNKNLNLMVNKMIENHPKETIRESGQKRPLMSHKGTFHSSPKMVNKATSNSQIADKLKRNHSSELRKEQQQEKGNGHPGGNNRSRQTLDKSFHSIADHNILSPINRDSGQEGPAEGQHNDTVFGSATSSPYASPPLSDPSFHSITRRSKVFTQMSSSTRKADVYAVTDVNIGASMQELIEEESWTGREPYTEYEDYSTRDSELDPVSTDTEDILMLRQY